MGYIYTKYGKRPKGKKKKNKRSRKRNKKKIIYNEWKEVSSRQKILDEIGFDSYEEYMSSDLWRKEIRPKVKERFKGVCQSCKLEMQGKGVQQIVHHREYTKANLDGDTIEGLTLVCKTCHSRAHQYTTDEVIVIRSLEKTNEWLDKPKPKTSIKKRKQGTKKKTKKVYSDEERKAFKKNVRTCATKGCETVTTKNKFCKKCRKGKKFNNKRKDGSVWPAEWRECEGCGTRMKRQGFCKGCTNPSVKHNPKVHEKNRVKMSDATKEKLERLKKQNRMKPSNSHTRKI